MSLILFYGIRGGRGSNRYGRDGPGPNAAGGRVHLTDEAVIDMDMIDAALLEEGIQLTANVTGLRCRNSLCQFGKECLADFRCLAEVRWQVIENQRPPMVYSDHDALHGT